MANELNVVTEPEKEKLSQVTIEITKTRHLYDVNDNPPFLTCIFSALQHSLMSICNSFSIAFILSELVCAGSDETLKTELMCSTLFVSGIATLLQSTIGIRLPLYQGPAMEYIIPLIALSDTPEWNCQMAIDTYFNQTNMSELSSNMTEVPRPVIYEKIQALSKYKDLEIEISKMWHVGTSTILVVVGAIGLVVKDSSRLIEGIPGSTCIKEIQKVVLTSSLMLIATLHIVLGATGLIGTFSRYIGPVTIIPMMLLIGLYIFRVIVKFGESHFGVAFATTSVAVVLSLYLRSYRMSLPSWSRAKGFHMTYSAAHNTFSILAATIFGWIICAILTASSLLSDDPKNKEFLARTDSKTYVISSAPWIFFPYPGCFGFSLSLSVSTIISFFVAMITAIIDSIADYDACAKICYVSSPPKHAVNRGVLVEGIATFIAGMIGIGHGTNSYGGNIGAIGITRVASRRVFQTVSIIFIFFGILGKLSAFFVTIPYPVLGGIQLIYFGSFLGIVLSNMQKIAMSHRNLSIIGVSVLVGMTLPLWIHNQQDITFTGEENVDNALLAVLRNPNFMGGLIAFLLDNICPGTMKERGLNLGMVEQMKSSENNHLKNEPQLSEKAVYGFPFYPRWLSELKIMKCMPFLPNYE